jgi:hypothetical protein
VPVVQSQVPVVQSTVPVVQSQVPVVQSIYLLLRAEPTPIHSIQIQPTDIASPENHECPPAYYRTDHILR